jgi:hypothetical protein
VDVVEQAVRAIEDCDWSRLKLMLHPYIRWTLDDGRTIQGRNRILAHLDAGVVTRPPVRHELRDGQIYWWVEEQRPPG